LLAGITYFAEHFNVRIMFTRKVLAVEVFGTKLSFKNFTATVHIRLTRQF